MANPLTTSFNIKGIEYSVTYFDADSFDHLDPTQIKQVYGVCFVHDEIVIGYSESKDEWSLIGGSVEPGETLEQTLRREIKEESNMEILSFKPIGYQTITNPQDGTSIHQLRYMSIVRSYGPFTGDSGVGMEGKGITEIQLIDPAIYREYFDWGEIGEQIILRAVDLKDELQN
jgi:ADP-ribose pyrophosphatase YjhB (NUDIX family)